MSANELTLKQQRWVNAYLETGNATEAARVAGYKGDENQLGVVGHGNLRKYKIRQFIEDRLSEERITSDEVLQILASQARADVADLFDENGRFSVTHLRQNKLGHLIKKIKCKRMIEGSGEDAKPVEMIEVELHSSQTAIGQICKMMGWEQMPAQNDRDWTRQSWASYQAANPDEPQDELLERFCALIAPQVPQIAAYREELARGQDSEAIS